MVSEIVITSAISDTARQCAKAFSGLFPSALSGPTTPDNDMLKDQLARFKIWAGILGVFTGGHSSADYRLRDDPDIKDIIVKLLQRLADNLESTPLQDASSQGPSEPEGKDDEDDYSSDSSLGLSEDVDLQDEEDEAPTETPLPQNIKVIDETITHLYKITSIIKKPDPNKEDHRISLWLKKEGSRLEHELQDLESYIEWSIERNFPRLEKSPSLKDRLVQTVLYRRRRLLYRESHRIKLEYGTHDSLVPKAPVSVSQSQPRLEPQTDEEPDGSIPTQPIFQRKAVTFVDTEASAVNRKGFSTYARSAVLSAITPSVQEGLEHLDVPPPPELSAGGAEAICPYCSLPLGRDIIGKGKGLQWTRHLLQDLQPYICLFTTCDSPLRQYKTKDDWINHMTSQHAKIWACQAKGHEEYLFRNPADLETHLQEEHPDTIHGDQISFIVEKSAKPTPDIFAALAAEIAPQNRNVLSACPFCDELETQLETLGDGIIATFPRESYKGIRDHMSGHLESIAFESLPPRDDVDNSLSGHCESDAAESLLATDAVNNIFSGHLTSSALESLLQKDADDMVSGYLGSLKLESLSPSQAPSDMDVDLKEPSSMDSNIDTMEQLLRKATLEAKEGGGKKWLPASDLDRICEPATVSRELQRSFEDHDAKRYTDYVCGTSEDTQNGENSSRMIFAILVFITKVPNLPWFINSGLRDKHLPFLWLDDTRTGLYSPSSPYGNRALPCFRTNDVSVMKQFYQTQWQLLVPFIARDSHNNVKEYQLYGDTIMPWTAYAVNVHNNGFSCVRQVEIHKSHHTFHEHKTFALKTLLQNNPIVSAHEFKSELYAFKKMRPEKHLLELCATFKIKKKESETYCFLFPWADGGSLEELWTKQPANMLPGKAVTPCLLLRWIAEQCHGLATALWSIHDVRQQALKKANMEDSKREEDDDEYYGIHGDINPGHILHFSQLESPTGLGILKIAGFGLTEFHTLGSSTTKLHRNMPAPGPTYRAPELVVPGEYFSRKVDIWALGCVFSQLITWAVRGVESVVEFDNLRKEERDFDEKKGSHMFKVDTFFKATYFANQGVRTSVKESTQKWLDDLQRTVQSDKGENFLTDFGNLIRHDMLENDRNKRIRCESLVQKLATFLTMEKGRPDDPYWNPQLPSFPQPSSNETIMPNCPKTEAAGLAIGIIGLGGLFNDAVDCFEYVQIGRGFGRDFQTSQLKLDVARLRLTRWGQSVGLGSALDEVQSLGSTALSPEDIPLAERILGQILDLFADAERVSKRFQQSPSSQKSLVVHSTAEHSTADLNTVPASLHQKMRDIAIRRQGRTGLREKAKWALYEEKQLSRLIEDVRDLVNDLVGLLPAVDVQQRLCEAEISEMDREADLALLKDAAADQDKLLSDAIGKSIGSSPKRYNVTFSGHSNSGLQPEINTGTVSQVSFGRPNLD